MLEGTFDQAAAPEYNPPPPPAPSRRRYVHGQGFSIGLIIRQIEEGKIVFADLPPRKKDRLCASLFLMGSTMRTISAMVSVSLPAARCHILRALENDGKELLSLPIETFAATAFGRMEELYERACGKDDLQTARAIVSDLWRMAQDLGKVPKAPLHAVLEDRRAPELSVEERIARIASLLERARASRLTIPGLPEKLPAASPAIEEAVLAEARHDVETAARSAGSGSPQPAGQHPTPAAEIRWEDGF